MDCNSDSNPLYAGFCSFRSHYDSRGKLQDKFGPRPVLFVSSILAGLGFFFSGLNLSVCRSDVFFGLVFGLCNGFLVYSSPTPAAVKLTLNNDTLKTLENQRFSSDGQTGYCTKTEYDAEAAFRLLYMGEQERRFFICYAVGAEKALLQAVFRAYLARKGLTPYPRNRASTA